MNIVVNDEIAHFNKPDFPILISGREGQGASVFSINLIVDLFRQGHKILLFTANRSARNDFHQALTPEELKEVEFVDKRDDTEGKRAIVINSNDEDTFTEVAGDLEDLEDRIVLVKNMEKYSLALFKVIRNNKLIILSGDIDKCPYSKDVKKKSFVTKIFFSKPQNYPVQNFIELQKREGMVVSKNHKGTVKFVL